MQPFIISAISFVIFLVLYRLILLEDKYKINSNESNLSCYKYVNDMLEYYGYDCNNVTVNTKKIYQYNVRENSIGIINFMSCKLSDIIASLHEVGHYIINNKTEKSYKLFKYSQYIIAINRLIIIPILFVGICVKVIFNYNSISINFQYILIPAFTVATLLRLFIGLTNEVLASKKAVNFIKIKGDKDMLLLSKKIYLNSLYNQIFFFVLFTLFAVIVFINI